MKTRFAKYQPGEKISFYKEVNEAVTHYLKEKKSDGLGNRAMYMKVCFCCTLFAVSYMQYLNAGHSWFQWLFWCMLLGFSGMLMGVNIAHDAIHQALFRKAWMNKMFGFSFDLVGISSAVWKLKHNLVHHRFPNVTGVDFDIEAAPLLRLSPADKWRRFHKYQHLYAPVVYMLFSMHLVFVNDFVLLLKERKTAIEGRDHRRMEYAALVFFKLFYIGYMLILPLFILPYSWWMIVSGFAIMHFSLSLLLSLVLLPAHLFEQTTFKTPDNGKIYEDWTLHQMATTLDFAAQSTVVHFLLGGFNTNVVHHLFPHICHCHYKPLSAIIAQKSSELGTPYHHTTLAGAIASHFKALKKLGQPYLGTRYEGRGTKL